MLCRLKRIFFMIELLPTSSRISASRYPFNSTSFLWTIASNLAASCPNCHEVTLLFEKLLGREISQRQQGLHFLSPVA